MTKKKKDYSYEKNLEKENELRKKGYQNIACVDEAGRGPFAGPVVAAAVILPEGVRIERLTDSKKLSKKEHHTFAEKAKKLALSWAVGVVSVEEIDEIDNIKKSAQLAMKRAIEGLQIKPDYILVDGREKIDLAIPQENVIKGDYYVHGISAAAIIAKTYRDAIMKELDEKTGWVYNWSKNAGYETKEHFEACVRHGLTKYHRKTWRKTMEKLKYKTKG